MKHLFVMDPLDRLDFAHDSTWMMMRECSRRGDAVAWCHPASLYGQGGRGCARAQRVVALAAHPYFELGEMEEGPLDAYDVVWMRKDPPFDMTYIFATYLLSHTTALVVNNPAGLRDRNEKLFAFGYADLTPETLFTQDISRILAFAKDQPDKIVLKPWDGNGGRGVLVTRHGDPNLRSMAEILTKEGTTAVIAQRYLPEIKQGDKRILLIAGEPVPYCLARIPKAGESRGNLAAGGKGVARPLMGRDREIAEALAPTLWARGLLIVGLDVIGDSLTEINVTSPTCFQEIMQQTGFDVAAMFIDALERAAGP